MIILKHAKRESNGNNEASSRNISGNVMSGRSIFVELDASGDISIARKSFQAM